MSKFYKVEDAGKVSVLIEKGEDKITAHSYDSTSDTVSSEEIPELTQNSYPNPITEITEEEFGKMLGSWAKNEEASSAIDDVAEEKAEEVQQETQDDQDMNGVDPAVDEVETDEEAVTE